MTLAYYSLSLGAVVTVPSGFNVANTILVSLSSEPYLISLTSKSDTFETFQHDGIETIYMLEGEIDYRHGDKVYPLKMGDTLFFDADAPHGPEKLTKLPAKYLSIISYPQIT